MKKRDTITRVFNGVEIRQRKSDQYLSATDMYKISGTVLGDFNRSQATEDFLKELSSVLQIQVAKLVHVISEGRAENQGIWIHPQVAMHFTQWCSPAFAVKLTKWLLELYGTGDSKQTSTKEKLLAHLDYQKKLLTKMNIPKDRRISCLNFSVEKRFGLNLLLTWGLERPSPSQKTELAKDEEENALTTIKLAARLKIQVPFVHQVLLKAGLQKKCIDSKDSSDYELTEEGKSYAFEDTNSPSREIKWYPSVIDLLLKKMRAASAKTLVGMVRQ